jgi:hypothetical protein
MPVWYDNLQKKHRRRTLLFQIRGVQQARDDVVRQDEEGLDSLQNGRTDPFPALVVQAFLRKCCETKPQKTSRMHMILFGNPLEMSFRLNVRTSSGFCINTQVHGLTATAF